MITPVLINRIKWKTYIIFTITSAAFLPIIYFFFPETSNISLEGIDKLFLPPEMQDYAERHASVGSIDWDRRESSPKSKGDGGLHDEKV